MCISRFDEETRNSILDLYSKIDAGIDLNEDSSESSEESIIEETENDY